MKEQENKGGIQKKNKLFSPNITQANKPTKKWAGYVACTEGRPRQYAQNSSKKKNSDC
jgi:hypothetical protein